MNFFVKVILCSIMFILSVTVVYYTSAFLLATISSVAIWDIIVLKESMLILLKPSNTISMGIRGGSLFIALGGGSAAAKSLWDELN